MGVVKTVHVVIDSRLGTRAIGGIGAGALGSTGGLPGERMVGYAGRPIHLEILAKAFVLALDLLQPGTKRPVLLGKRSDHPLIFQNVTFLAHLTKGHVLRCKCSDGLGIVLGVTFQHENLFVATLVKVTLLILGDLDGEPPALRGLSVGTVQHMEKAVDNGGVL
jgi:hypothetical protein